MRGLIAKYFEGHNDKKGYWACIVYVNGRALGGPILKYKNGKEIHNKKCPTDTLFAAMRRAYPNDNNLSVDRPRINHTGKKICCLQCLIQAALDKKSVFAPTTRNWSKQRPAAFMINLSGTILNRLINQGMYIYEKEI